MASARRNVNQRLMRRSDLGSYELFEPFVVEIQGLAIEI
jgi:hypothetical protein